MLRSGLSHQDPVFVQRCLDLLESAQEGSIVLRGPFEPDDLSGRMEVTDVVVMASRWYENAPMVIQESFSHSVPVIAPRLGGMAEKIQHEYNGYLFDPVSPTGLEVALRWFASNPAVLSSMKEQAGPQLLAPACAGSASASLPAIIVSMSEIYGAIDHFYEIVPGRWLLIGWSSQKLIEDVVFETTQQQRRSVPVCPVRLPRMDVAKALNDQRFVQAGFVAFITEDICSEVQFVELGSQSVACQPLKLHRNARLGPDVFTIF